MRTIPKNTTVKHGSLTMYSYGCRCAPCKLAKKNHVTTKIKVEHGTYARYRYGCRCDLCNKANRKEKTCISTFRRRTKKLEYIWSLKTAPCTDCGQKFHPVCMDFDHINGEKRQKGVCSMTGCSIAEIDKEIAKCELVCSNCHRLRTYNRGYISRGKHVVFHKYTT